MRVRCIVGERFPGHCRGCPRVSAEHEIDICKAIHFGPNLLQVYGFCLDAPDGKPRIVMEWCPHGSLRQHLKKLPASKVTACQAVTAFEGALTFQHLWAPVGTCWFVSPPLADRLQLTLPYVLSIAEQLTVGVRLLHACGVLHRDLKTDNALVSSVDPLVVKWADFGVSVKFTAADADPGPYGREYCLTGAYLRIRVSVCAGARVLVSE